MMSETRIRRTRQLYLILNAISIYKNERRERAIAFQRHINQIKDEQRLLQDERLQQALRRLGRA